MLMSRRSLLAGVAGAFTVGAGLVHAGAAVAHEGESQLLVLFALTAVAQVVLGTAVAAMPGRLVLVVATSVNLAVASAWAASRLTGVPFVEALAHTHPIGVQDLTATLMELVAAAAGLFAVWNHYSLSARWLSGVCALALVPALVAINAGHSHPGEGHRAPAGARLATDPVFSGADTSHADTGELAAAKALIVATRDFVLRTFPDETSVVAAGYQSIGDGRFSGTYEHFVHPEYLSDGRELDPHHIESIVLENTGHGKRVASAMYILELGTTMADVPDIAGELTAWHDHQNLCWDESGIRLAGVLVEGRCVPQGTFRPTPPMLHVWLQDHPCGPFAGIDGHGGSCAGHHTS